MKGGKTDEKNDYNTAFLRNKLFDETFNFN